VSESIAPNASREGQLRSPFTPILETFCESLVGAIAAGIVDELGECVDLAQLPVFDKGGRMEAYDVKLSGAHWQLVLRDAAAKLQANELWIQADTGFVLRMLFAGYVLVLVCRPDAVHSVSRRALRQVEVELYREATWAVPDAHVPYWRRVQVKLGHKGQPKALRFARPVLASSHLPPEPWDEHLKIIGPAPGIDGLERGFQVVTADQQELPLIREPTGFWYLGCTL
jgi:hypothetical protein